MNKRLVSWLFFGMGLGPAVTARAEAAGPVTVSSATAPAGPVIAPAGEGPVTALADATARTFAPLDAVASAARHNPELAAALADLRGVKASVEGEEHRYALVWGAEVGATRTKNPSLGPAGTMVPKTDEVALSTDLRRRFAQGGNVGVTVSGKRMTMRTYFGMPPQAFTFGPAYGTSVKLDATQPLLRGFGSAIGEANLHQARIQVEQAAATLHRTTSDNLAAVLRAYWELAYAQDALQIQRQALLLAQQQREEAQARVDTGALANVELTSFEARIAQLESDNGDAEVEVERRRIELERLCAVDTQRTILQAPPEAIDSAMPNYNELRLTAFARSPTLRELKATAALAQSRASIAGDSLRPALDVNAYVQAQGLSNRDVGPALSQVGELSALSAHVGLRYETALDSTQRRMQASEAQFAVRAAKKRVEAAERQLEANLQKSFAEGRAASGRVQLARRAVELAERQHQAEKSLFETGSSTAIRVREAEEQVRSSRIKWLRARIDALGSQIELDRVSGRLGEAYLATVTEGAQN